MQQSLQPGQPPGALQRDDVPRQPQIALALVVQTPRRRLEEQEGFAWRQVPELGCRQAMFQRVGQECIPIPLLAYAGGLAFSSSTPKLITSAMAPSTAVTTVVNPSASRMLHASCTV